MNKIAETPTPFPRHLLGIILRILASTPNAVLPRQLLRRVDEELFLLADSMLRHRRRASECMYIDVVIFGFKTRWNLFTGGIELFWFDDSRPMPTLTASPDVRRTPEITDDRVICIVTLNKLLIENGVIEVKDLTLENEEDARVAAVLVQAFQRLSKSANPVGNEAPDWAKDPPPEGMFTHGPLSGQVKHIQTATNRSRQQLLNFHGKSHWIWKAENGVFHIHFKDDKRYQSAKDIFDGLAP